jgi:hypothetical protein
MTNLTISKRPTLATRDIWNVYNAVLRALAVLPQPSCPEPFCTWEKFAPELLREGRAKIWYAGDYVLFVAPSASGDLTITALEADGKTYAPNLTARIRAEYHGPNASL